MFKASDYTNFLQQLEQFFAETTPENKVTHNLTPTELQQQLELSLTLHGESVENLENCIATYLKYAVKTAHPTYFNQLWGGFDSACFMGDILTSATNTSMYTYEVAPIATLIEKVVIAKMSGLVGFSQSEGQFTTGGSNGNLMAMAMAMHRACPTLKHAGLANGPTLIAFVSEDTHYSFAKAAHLLGMGIDQLWQVPIDASGKMRIDELEQLIAKAKSQLAKPFFVAGIAGTTVRGAYDRFEDIAAVAQRENLWFHVDGAWGASVLLSSKHRHLMKGIEQADSVVWDAHKMMGMTLICSVLLVRHPGRMLNTFSTGKAGYIFHTLDEALDDIATSIDLGPATMHCGRRVDAVKLWLTWKQLGDRGWENRINHYFDLADRAEEIINSHASLELMVPRQSLNLCFQYVPQNPKHDRNMLVQKIRQTLLEDGVAMVNYAKINDKFVFRLVLCNNQSKVQDIDHFFNALVATGKRLESQLESQLESLENMDK